MSYVVSPYLRYYKDKRNIVYNFLLNKFQPINIDDIEILLFCIQPKEHHELLLKFPENKIKRIIAKQQILDANTLWSLNSIQQLEIETSTVCNWRCEYCPVRFHKRDKKMIDHALFTMILDKCLVYPTIKWVSLHFYNEPTIDPNFMFYLSEIKKRGMKLLLYTNGSHLTDSVLRYIKQNMNETRFIINLPSIEIQKFCQLTGSRNYNNTIQAIRTATQLELDLSISVQGTGFKQKNEIEKIRKLFPSIPLYMYESYDRAGSLNNEYYQNIMIKDPYLTGCFMVTDRVIISVDGYLLLCCNDYHHINQLGNIKDKSLHDLLSNPKINQARQYIWGGAKATDEFICRKCVLMRDSIHEKVYKKIL